MAIVESVRTLDDWQNLGTYLGIGDLSNVNETGRRRLRLSACGNRLLFSVSETEILIFKPDLSEPPLTLQIGDLSSLEGNGFVGTSGASYSFSLERPNTNPFSNALSVGTGPVWVLDDRIYALANRNANVEIGGGNMVTALLEYTLDGQLLGGKRE